MANTDAKEDGVYAWMASVRTSMANDPCRQLFEDQVQTHAFIFLDDYLEHILAGPKQGPIIDLVKTPGRKKNIPRRTRAATAASAKVKSTTLFSLDGDKSTKDTPVNSFHKALLEVKETSTGIARDSQKSPCHLLSTSSSSTEKTHGQSNSVQLLNIPEITVSIVPDLHASVVPPQHYPKGPSSEFSAPFQPSERGTELSVIAEGDESPERSHVNTLPSSALTSNHEEFPGTVPRPQYEAQDYPSTEEMIQTDQVSEEDPSIDARYVVMSSETYHPIPLDSPQQVQSEARMGNYTEPLPSATTIDLPGQLERNAFTAPLPVVPASNPTPIPHTISVPLNDISPKKLAHKGSIAGFPVLPAPSPLRKSMRVAQEVLAGSALPTTTPAPVPLGKRTSWLMKAREAKAMEGTSSLPGTSVAAIHAAFPPVPTAVKRKSGEMLGAHPFTSDWDKDQRKPKVAKSTEVVPLVSKETETTYDRNRPSAQSELLTLHSITAEMSVDHLESHAMGIDEQLTQTNSAEEGFIDLFKRTVEGLGARTGKSMGKSLGGSAVVALAEARAAAEARVAERNKINESNDSEVPSDDGLPHQEALKARLQPDIQFPSVPAPEVEEIKRRLSLSDLAPDTARPNEPELATKEIQFDGSDESISTTPPDSPPSKGNSGFVKPAGPVFNKPPPPPVFMPPVSKQVSLHSKGFPSNGPSGQSTLPAALSLGIPARLTATSPPLVQGMPQLSSQSSILPNPTFDKRDAVPTWAPSLEGTPYTIESQPGNVRPVTAPVIDDDDDDSWPLEEKLAAEPGWRPFDFSNVDKEDTWSSCPTESQGPTKRLTAEKNGDTSPLSDETNVDVEMNNEVQENVEMSDTERSMMAAGELEEVAEACLDHVEPLARVTRQISTVSSASSSQLQAGFLSQATKLVNSVLGGGKKVKPELKSLQLAAAAAKKQKEEVDKKMQRLKEMEARRQVVIAKKESDEKTRLVEEEKKNKEELEKRKREREENTDRRPLKPSVSTKDDAAKKRKLAPESEKKPEGKKPPSKDKRDLLPAPKVAATPVTKIATQRSAKATAPALVSSTAYNTTQNAPPAPSAKSIIPEAKPFKVVPSSLKGKAKAKPQEDDIGDKLPSTMVQSQMAARAKAQMQAAKVPTPEVPSESIELPDINSEYSDSDDEDRVRSFDPPDWAQSPELRQALELQSTVNPDDIFGAIRPLRMDEMFRTRQSRFRPRSSSANWSGSDRLTVEEIREYERRMGFQPSRTS